MAAAASIGAIAKLHIALLGTLAAPAFADMVKNWKASLLTPASAGQYKVAFDWDHEAADAVVIGWTDKTTGGNKATDDPRCSGSSDVKASDGQPYWMPRFFSRPVSAEITAQTGIEFVSADWQPCGHKDITICHGESHYDFHAYYVPETALSAQPMCTIGSSVNPKLPVCSYSTNPANAAYYNLISNNMPTAAKVTKANSKVDKQFNFCVDPSSAILRSGIHYGDKSETLDEWKTPVTIIGSHDCQLKFFEPMVSWKWISGKVESSTWPTFEVSDIQYSKKTYEALPHSWSINVSEGCKTGNAACHIRIIMEGTKCPAGGCLLKRECGSMKDCVSGLPWNPNGTTASSANSSSSASTSASSNSSFTSSLESPGRTPSAAPGVVGSASSPSFSSCVAPSIVGLCLYLCVLTRLMLD